MCACCARGAVRVLMCRGAVPVVLSRDVVLVVCSWLVVSSWGFARAALVVMCACRARGGVLARGAALVVLYVCCARARSWCVSPVFVLFSWWCGRDGVCVLFSW